MNCNSVGLKSFMVCVCCATSANPNTRPPHFLRDFMQSTFYACNPFSNSFSVYMQARKHSHTNRGRERERKRHRYHPETISISKNTIQIFWMLMLQVLWYWCCCFFSACISGFFCGVAYITWSNEQIRYCLNSIARRFPLFFLNRFIKVILIFVYGRNVFQVRKEI